MFLRRFLAGFSALLVLGACLPFAPPAAAADCRFILGFATLHQLVPASGACLDNQAFAANGDAVQHTTAGLMAWRKADNWTAFTDGYRTWVNGPNGVQERLNTQRFPWEHDLQAASGQAGPFAGWALSAATADASGVRLGPAAATSPASAGTDGGASPSCAADAIDGGSASADAGSGLCLGHDPAGEYNGGSFYFGSLSSPMVIADFRQLVASWDATTPAGTWIQPHARALENGAWSHWYALPVWASGTGTLRRHSVNGQDDASGKVATDTLIVPDASAYQLELTLFSTNASVTPAVRLLHAATQPAAGAGDRRAWGMDLPVPQRSQMLAQYSGLGFGGGGEVWCSPTSTSMAMAYWSAITGDSGQNQSVPAVAQGVYDYTYAGTGDWPFNTAYAASHGLVAYVARMSSFDQLEPWIAARVPIAISIAFGPGELPGAPIASSPGHLIVLRGFTADGDPIVNDPAAANDAEVRIVYHRGALERAWQHGSNGAAYVIYPPGWAIPG